MTRIGDDGIRDTRAALRADLGAAALRLSAGRQQDNGQPDLADDRRIDRADMRLDWRIAADQQIEFHAGAVQENLQMGRFDDPSDPLRDRNDDTAFGQIRWRLTRSADEELQVTYFHQQESSRDAYSVLLRNALDPAPPPDIIDMVLASYGLSPDARVNVDFASRVIRDDIEFEHMLRIGETNRLVWGAGHREDRLWSPAVFNTDENIVDRTSRLFGNLEWRPAPRWLLNFGATAERPKSGEMHMAPRFAANYHVTSKHTLRFSVSRAYRMPTPYETFGDLQFREALSGKLIRYTLQPSPDLDPERLTATEIGYLGRFLERRLTVDLRLFSEQVSDLIERDKDAAAPAGGDSVLGGRVAPRYRNTGKARIRGAELSLIYRPALNKWLGFNYTNLDINSDGLRGTPGDLLQIQLPLATTTVPAQSANLFAHWSLSEGWSASASHSFTGSMNWYATRTRLVVPAYHRTDLRLARRLTLGRSRAELALTLQNIGSRNADFTPRAGGRAAQLPDFQHGALSGCSADFAQPSHTARPRRPGRRRGEYRAPAATPIAAVIVMSDPAPAYDEAMSALRETLERLMPDTRPSVIDWQNLSTLGPRQAVVTIGTQTARAVAESNYRGPVLHALVPHSGFEWLGSGRRGQVSAIFIDQPAERQIALIREALPEWRRVALLAGPASAATAQSLSQAAREQRLQPMTEQARSDEGLYAALQNCWPNPRFWWRPRIPMCSTAIPSRTSCSPHTGSVRPSSAIRRPMCGQARYWRSIPRHDRSAFTQPRYSAHSLRARACPRLSPAVTSKLPPTRTSHVLSASPLRAPKESGTGC